MVGGRSGEVSYSDDGGETFTELDEPTPTEGYVTVAFDTYFDENHVIYAATDAGSAGGIYMWKIGESEEWTDIDAWHGVGYTGLVVSFDATGNPYTSPETGGVLYASFVGYDGSCGKTGVARSLTPIFEVCCNIGDTTWDYLMESNPEDMFYNECQGGDFVDFEATPDPVVHGSGSSRGQSGAG